VVRVKAINIIKQIEDRESLLDILKQTVRSLSEEDEADLQNKDTTTAKSLKDMSDSLQQATDSVVKQILHFLSQYQKYFGRVFVFDDTDYLQVARREAHEIKQVVSFIRQDDE